MSDWDVEPISDVDRQSAMENFDPDKIDPQFIPYIEKINALPFAVTVQCCIGHMPYEKWKGPKEQWPYDHSGKWGYLQLMLSIDATERICQQAGSWGWFWEEGSDLVHFSMDTLIPTTKHGSCMIALAWDAKHWPAPADDILAALDDFYRNQ